MFKLSNVHMVVIDGFLKEQNSKLTEEIFRICKKKFIKCKYLNNEKNSSDSSIIFKRENEFPSILFFFTTISSPNYNFQADYTISSEKLIVSDDVSIVIDSLLNRYIANSFFKPSNENQIVNDNEDFNTALFQSYEDIVQDTLNTDNDNLFNFVLE